MVGFEGDLVLLAALGQRAPAPHVQFCYPHDASIFIKLKWRCCPRFESGPRGMLSTRRDGIHTMRQALPMLSRDRSWCH